MDAALNLEALKNKYKEDSLPHHIWSIALDCKKRRDAFWRHTKKMKIYNNLISIPLLLLSSVSGLTSVASISTANSNSDLQDGGSDDKNVMPIVVSVFSVTAALVTALQRYFRFAERAQHSKHMAKNYARIARRIENTMVLVESSAITMEASMFLKFMEEIQRDTDSLMQEMDDLPRELMHKKTNDGHKQTPKDLNPSSTLQGVVTIGEPSIEMTKDMVMSSKNLDDSSISPTYPRKVFNNALANL